MQGRKKKKDVCPFLLLENSRPLSPPWRPRTLINLPRNWLSLFFGGKKKGICCNKPLSKITDDINLILFFLFSNWKGIILMQDYFFFCCISGYNNITWIVMLTSGWIPLSVNNNKMRNNTQASKSFISIL